MQHYSKETREGGKVVGNFGSDGILGGFYFLVAGGWSVFPKQHYFVPHTSYRPKVNTHMLYHYQVFLISV